MLMRTCLRACGLPLSAEPANADGGCRVFLLCRTAGSIEGVVPCYCPAPAFRACHSDIIVYLVFAEAPFNFTPCT